MAQPGMNNVITRVKRVPLDSVAQHPDNPNNGDVEAIAESLATNGMYRPLVVQESTGHILAGNHTYAAALSLGWTHVQAAYVDVDDDKALRILLADNRTNQLGRTDDAALLEILANLDGLIGTGYTDTDLDDLAAVLEESSSRPINLNGDSAEPGAGSSPHSKDGEEGGNSRFTPSYGDYAERYLDKSTRVFVLEYPLDRYNTLAGQLQQLRQRYGVESNADVVARLVDEAEAPA
jgi:hypothetical protein